MANDARSEKGEELENVGQIKNPGQGVRSTYVWVLEKILFRWAKP